MLGQRSRQRRICGSDCGRIRFGGVTFMDRQEKEQRKRRKQLEKERIRRHKKIEKGLDLCLTAACFLAFLAAAAMQALREVKDSAAG